MKLLNVLQGQVEKIPPIWIMRQAGRYLPEYLKLRALSSSFMEFCLCPEKTVEATLQPIRRFDLDAAIIFSDILIIPYALGQKVQFVQGEGPKLGPLHDIESHFDGFDVESFHQKLQPVYQALNQVRQNLAKDKALIGFAGAPWTVLTYMCEGGGSKTFDKTKQMAWSHPKLLNQLLDLIVDATSQYIIQQIQSGADVIQIFDSWAGHVPYALRHQCVYRPTAQIVQNIREKFDVPIIGFARGLSHLLNEYQHATQVTAAGLDTFMDPYQITGTYPVQGGLDSALLCAGGPHLETQIQSYLDAFKNRAYIFNLGHGILPHTPIQNVEQMIQLVRQGIR